jgi:CRP-like cAMP-binding protein
LKESVSKTIKKREILYHEGDTPNSIYLIQKGMVGLFRIAENGKESLLRLFSENNLLGHRSMIAEEEYHATAVALTDVELLVISKEEWSKLIQIPEINSKLLKQLASDLGHSELRLAGLVDKPAKLRIVESLIFLKLKHAGHIFTRKEIAEFAGSTTETTARVMSELESSSLLVKDGRDYIIPDPEKALQYFME